MSYQFFSKDEKKHATIYTSEAEKHGPLKSPTRQKTIDKHNCCNWYIVACNISGTKNSNGNHMLKSVSHSLLNAGLSGNDPFP